jgi:protein-disulfide isomerase
LVAVVAVILVIVLSDTGSGTSTTAKATPGPTAAAPQHGASFGQDNAPLTLVEYFGFQCVHCADFAIQVEPQIEKDYVDTGKLKIEFRPLGSGDALLASQAVACAGEQDRYVEYYKYLFANHLRGFGKGNLRDYAGDLGLDTAAFNECLDSNKYEETVVSDTNAAMRLNLGTPTFYLGKTNEIANQSLPYTGVTTIVGAQPYDAFKKAIDDALAGVQ